ncbi:hydantoinase B/oxoprolinase family protein [Enterovirga aerilata]|uniref:Hydantoinase B/oxoprolinase family protein n=1 Tax=Enterovirga aerilata TaxID=2730920 RepID=A0A849ID47_9HYPH|nr:hydantoinase B/oxoprolinase family protein [Enterovirga sp. DB1703]NNM74155.1 hydantoinase B/oxoprolinase family protein [Enterovirga sp. DB1703]
MMSCSAANHAGLPDRVDAVTASVISSTLIAIAEEMGTALRNSAYSAAVREGDDFSTALFDRYGRLVAQGNFTPGHLGSMPFVLQHVLRYYPESSLRPGDGIFLNDAALGSGHFPDCYLVSPIHLQDRVVGYVASIAHHVDVGGAAPGSQLVQGVSEAYQEGIRILPVRAVRNDEFDEEFLRIFLGNVRLPDIVRGDLTAQKSANHIGAARFLELFAKHGAATMDRAIEHLLDVAEAATREEIRRIPSGSYRFSDYFDDAGPGTEPICVSVEVTVQDGNITFDFSDSSDQVGAAINSYLNYTRAYCFFAVKVFTDPRLPQNDGAIRPITVTSREGSFFNPTFPAPSGGRATIQVRIFEAISGALAEAVPNKAIAAFSHWSNPNIGGVDEKTGRPFIFYDLIMGGYGAMQSRDGAEALAAVMNCANIPIEMHERANPIRIRHFGFLPDSGGAGQFRGGCGIRKDVEVLTASARASLLSDRHVHAPYGLAGGKPGKLGETVLLRDGQARNLSSKETVMLRRGDILSFRLSGGGGFGDPALRETAAIERDLEEGYTTLDASRACYPQFKPESNPS